MKLRDLKRHEVEAGLHNGSLPIEVGPFVVRLKTRFPEVIDRVALLYADYSVHAGEFADFWVAVAPGNGFRRWFHPQARFLFDGHEPFAPLVRAQGYAFFEWGLNWCIANHMHVWLILHAAVLERGGCALVMPGSPGKGKSTLAAALMLRGWRLLSDEFALLSPGDLCLTPVPRPVSLKNESIEAIRRFAPESVIGQASYDTAKGTVAHLRPTPESVMKSAQVARPRWIVFPRFVAGAAGELSPRSKARTLLEAAQNGFNYAILAETAFDALAAALDDCECYDFCYGDLEEAVDVFGRLAAAA